MALVHRNLVKCHVETSGGAEVDRAQGLRLRFDESRTVQRKERGGYMAEKRTEFAPRETQGLAHRGPSSEVGSPFGMLERFADEVDRCSMISDSVAASVLEALAAGCALH